MEEPIVAIATGNINSAIGIIRCSGSGIREEINKILHKPIQITDDHKIQFRRIIFDGEEYDQGMVAYFKAPHSYTGEDSVELYLHGNVINLKRIVELLIRHTACRLAEPGEFTRRAFLNGKMDLTQAEAVAEFISAESERALQTSLKHLEGDIKIFLKDVRQKFIHILSLLETELDFAEEDIEFVERPKILKEIEQIEIKLKNALNSYRYGNLLRNGVRVAIIGKPNVGKSSLLNAILGKERAIVSEIPGTTRDFIEASLHVEGLLIHFIDTAGIRAAEEKIEQTGIQYSKKIFQESDVIILVLDALTGISDEDITLIEQTKQHQLHQIIWAINKTDTCGKDRIDAIIDQLKNHVQEIESILPISALKRTHIDKLLKRITNKIIKQSRVSDESLIITSLRQANLIEQVLQELDSVKKSIEAGQPAEMLAFDLRSAMEKIGEITGEITTDEILNHIFSSFCIGK